MKAIIVGGGIGGLASALALRDRGWEVELLEQASEFSEVGAGLSLWPNGMRALQELGVDEAVRDRAVLAGQTSIRDASGRQLSGTDTAQLQARYGPMAIIHRAELVAVLRAALPDEVLHLDVTVTSAAADGTVTHSAGESVGDLVVGADGIRSVVRSSAWPETDPPRYVGYAAWRMVTPAVPTDGLSESWGAGRRFGYAPLVDGRVYCFAVANSPEGTPSGGLAALRASFGDWHDPIPELLAAADPEAVLHNDLYELPALKSYTTGRLALLGDAAHAMTPDMGQGACQALEDAVALAKSLGGERGLEEYDRLRRRRTQWIARRAHRIGAVAQWQSPAAVFLRNNLLRSLPRSSFARSLAPVLDWEP